MAPIEVTECLALLATPRTNEEVSEAFILCCYTGLRWVDLHRLRALVDFYGGGKIRIAHMILVA